MRSRVLATIAGKELRDARRNRWFVLFAAVFTLAALGLSVLGLSGLGTFGLAGFGRTTASLLQLVMLLVPLMGLLLGAMSIAGEREQGTLLTVLAQPVTAVEVFAGKTLGTLAAVAGVVAVGFLVSGAFLASATSLDRVGGFLTLAACTALLGGVHVGLGLLLSVWAGRTATAVGLALLVWLTVVFLSDLGVIGTAMVLRLTPGQLLWVSLMNPVQAFKLVALPALHGTLDTLGPSGRYAADVLGPWLRLVMASVLAAWMAAALGLAAWTFRRRGAL